MAPEEGIPLNTIRTGKPAQQALAAAGYKELADLTNVTERELLQLHGMGPKALGILREALQKEGLSFATENEETKRKGK